MGRRGYRRSSDVRSLILLSRAALSPMWRGIWGSASNRSTSGEGRTASIRLIAGLTSVEKAELTAAKKRITELETELAVARRAVELLKDAGDRTDPKGGSRRSR